MWSDAALGVGALVRGEPNLGNWVFILGSFWGPKMGYFFVQNGYHFVFLEIVILFVYTAVGPPLRKKTNSKVDPGEVPVTEETNSKSIPP